MLCQGFPQRCKQFHSFGQQPLGLSHAKYLSFSELIRIAIHTTDACIRNPKRMSENHKLLYLLGATFIKCTI